MTWGFRLVLSSSFISVFFLSNALLSSYQHLRDRDRGHSLRRTRRHHNNSSNIAHRRSRTVDRSHSLPSSGEPIAEGVSEVAAGLLNSSSVNLAREDHHIVNKMSATDVPRPDDMNDKV